MKRLFYRKTQRVLTESDFKRILAGRVSAGHGPMRLFLGRNQLNLARFGISVGKSIGSAVVRNRLKRLARETFRQNQHNLPLGIDYLLIISRKMTKKSAKDMALPEVSYNQFCEIVLQLVEKACPRLPDLATLKPDSDTAPDA